MSTSFIYHCLGLVGYRYIKAEYKDSRMIISVQKNPYKVCCPDCESTNFIRRGKITRTFKTLPIGKKPILIKVDIQRIQCLDCGCLKQEKLNFADPKKTYTRAFERYVLSLVKLMTIQDVAIHLGISWNTVKEIQKKFLQNHFSNPNFRTPVLPTPKAQVNQFCLFGYQFYYYLIVHIRYTSSQQNFFC